MGPIYFLDEHCPPRYKVLIINKWVKQDLSQLARATHGAFFVAILFLLAIYSVGIQYSHLKLRSFPGFLRFTMLFGMNFLSFSCAFIENRIGKPQ